MKRFLFILIASLYALAGCNTMEGAGRDIQKAGDKIEDAAQKKK
jgi:predicted small secreted protein